MIKEWFWSYRRGLNDELRKRGSQPPPLALKNWVILGQLLRPHAVSYMVSSTTSRLKLRQENIMINNNWIYRSKQSACLLVHLCGLHARSGKYAPSNCSRTQKGGGMGRHSTTHLRRPIVAVHRLTGHPCNGKWTVRGPEEKGPAKRTAGSPLRVVPKKLISPQSTHTQTKPQ